MLKTENKQQAGFSTSNEVGPTTLDQQIPQGHQGTPSKITRFPETPSHNQSPSEGKKILTFIGCVFMIYLLQIVNGIVEERIYKVPYKNNSSSSSDFYTDPLTPMLFSSFFAAAIGFLRMEDHEMGLEIPAMKLLKLTLLEIGIHFSLMWALMNASYILVVMVNSCGLLSVILVSVYFGRGRVQGQQYEPRDEAQDGQTHEDGVQGQGQRRNENQVIGSSSHNASKTKAIGAQKILICLIVCMGIFTFNYFTPERPSHSTQTNQSASLLTFAVLVLAIVLEGFRPEMQSQIKRQYQPSPISFYFNYYKVQCIVVLVLSIVSWQLPYTLQFIINHDELFLHLIVLSLTSAISAIFIYKIISLFRQHVYPLVSTVRKCITVGVSILYFGHHIAFMQLVGIILVFGGVMLQIAMNYKLLQKWGIDLPFQSQDSKIQRYVKNRNLKDVDNSPVIRKKYQVYKILHKDAQIQGI